MKLIKMCHKIAQCISNFEKGFIRVYCTNGNKDQKEEKNAKEKGN